MTGGLRRKVSDRLLALVSPRGRDARRIAASGLFDAAWYAGKYPESEAYSGGPLAHYMAIGARELKDPNPFFDAAWYCAGRPEARTHPLLHYLERGAAEGLRPSPAFDPAWYRAVYRDVAEAGIEPLTHFLGAGRAEERLPRAPDDARPADEAELRRLKAPTPRETMALFVTYAPGGRIKRHVPSYLSALAGEGIATTLIVATDSPADADVEGVRDLVDGLFVRANAGFDFAAWAHVARGLDLSKTQTLFLTNDSLVGPLNAERFGALIDRVRRSDADLVGLSESFEIRRHFQSFFLAAKGKGVAALLDCLGEVKAFSNKRAVILAYELPLLDRFRAAGLSAEALFPAVTRGNATLEDWRALVARGFPFVKAAALQAAEGDWRAVLSAEGYDPALAEDAAASAKPPSLTPHSPGTGSLR